MFSFSKISSLFGWGASTVSVSATGAAPQGQVASSLGGVGAPSHESAGARWIQRVIKVILLAVTFVAPIASLPFTQDSLLVKVVFVEIAAIATAGTDFTTFQIKIKH